MAKGATGGTSISPKTDGPFVVIISPEAQSHIARLPYDWGQGLRPAWENLEKNPIQGQGRRRLTKIPARIKLYPGEMLFHYMWGTLAIWYSVFEDPEIRLVYVHRVQPFIL